MEGTSTPESSADIELQPHHSIDITTTQPNFPSSIYVSGMESCYDTNQSN